MALALMATVSIGTEARKVWDYKPAVSILGDSYSTFEGYIEPKTNEMWYFKTFRTSVLMSMT